MKKQNFTIIIVIVALLAVGVGLNFYWERSQVNVDGEGNPVPNIATPVYSPTPPPATASAPANPAASAPPQLKSASAPSQSLPSELQLGNPKAAITVGLGYTMDPTTAANPSNAAAIVSTLSTWAKSHPDTKVKIVSLDLPKDQLSDPSDASIPLGLSVNGAPVAGLNGNPGEGKFTPNGFAAAIHTVK